MPKRSLREERLAKGLCPNCGAEAAPYRLCGDCRTKLLIGRYLDKASVSGDVIRTKQGGKVYYQANPERKGDWHVKYRPAEDGDRRNLPRLRNVPIDVIEQLVKIFRAAGKPLQMEEIYEAWGKLRLRANRTSAAMDLAYIVSAKRKRSEKMARRAERHRKQVEADARRGVPAPC